MNIITYIRTFIRKMSRLSPDKAVRKIYAISEGLDDVIKDNNQEIDEKILLIEDLDRDVLYLNDINKKSKNLSMNLLKNVEKLNATF